jgi:4-amino-4-deoxy-L-arabinose transferase-like glycosyltransferase
VPFVRRPAPLPIALFVASALFVLWRQTEIGALVDIAYILNTASRIAAGDVPYSQFRLAHPPITFAVQALLIRAFGPHYVVQMLYTSVAGGTATLLTYGIARRILRDVVSRPNVLAAILCVPLIPLGIYAIFPHPHYDPDACLAMLAGLTAVLAARVHPTAGRWLIAGMILVIPLFVKQNIGGAFLPLVVGALAVEAVGERPKLAGVGWCVVGVAAGLAVAIVALQIVAGMDHYVAWTVAYAMAERGVYLDRLGAFGDLRSIGVGLLLPVVAVASRAVPPRVRIPLFIGVVALPLAVIAGIAAPLLWVPLVIGAAAMALIRAARGRVRFETLLPIVCAGTLAGTLMSQGLGGSTFGIFPLLVVSTASLTRELHDWSAAPRARLAGVFAVVVSVLLVVSGTPYTLANDRMRFIDLAPTSPIVRSTDPSLWGLSARGPYVGELDELLAWVRGHVAEGEPATFLPGEDPVYFALGLHPGLPVVQYIDGSDPYTPDELLRIAEATGLRWVFVKERLQLQDGPPDGPAIAALLSRDADLVAQFGPYRVYRRR